MAETTAQVITSVSQDMSDVSFAGPKRHVFD